MSVPQHRNITETNMSYSLSALPNNVRNRNGTTNGPSQSQPHVHFAPKVHVSSRLYPPPKTKAKKKETEEPKKVDAARVLQSPSTVTPQLKLMHRNIVKHPSAFR